MLFGHRSPNGPNHRLDIQQQTHLRRRVRFPILRVSIRRLVAALYLGCDD
jgi:hypothetical protein